MKRILWVVGALIGIALTSCQPINPRVSTLWTNLPEIVGYVEIFNASQSRWQILIEYKSDPARELSTPGIKADLVVGKYLDSKVLRSSLTSLSFLFDRGGVTKSMFYPNLLALGSDGDNPILVPLSFDLPILVFRRGALNDPDGIALSFHYVQSSSQSFDEATRPEFHRFAFSPRWNGFTTTALAALGVRFGEDFRGRLTWDQQRLDSAVDYLNTWIQGSDSGLEEKDFTLKYQHSNPFQLLEDGRVLYAATTLRNFLTLPDEERRGLEFRYPEAENGVPVQDDIVWAAIPSSALTRSAAQAFLSWYFQNETQISLVRSTHDEYFRSFGISGGLDSLQRVNQDVLPRYYPELVGRVPPASVLDFPPTQPNDWPVLRTRILEPWLEKKLQGKAVEDLGKSVERWYRETTSR